MTSLNVGENERTSKILRSSMEPDLKVIVGQSDGASEKWYHSITLASKSKYIDAMLSSPMKEKEDSIITFPDIDGGTWDEMMNYLDNPAYARKMKLDDALKLAPLYDKYEFMGGTSLCDVVLDEWLSSLKGMEKDQSLDVGSIVNAIEIAHNANLKVALYRGVKYCVEKMHSANVPYGSTMFSKDHMKTLAPIISDVSSLKGNPHELIFRGWKMSEESFPKAYATETARLFEKSLLDQCITSYKISGITGIPYSGVKGDYTKDRNGAFTCGCFSLKKCKTDSFEGWVIMETDINRHYAGRQPQEQYLWVSPCSSTLNYPPMNNWKSVHKDATGTPKVTYLLKKWLNGPREPQPKKRKQTGSA